MSVLDLKADREAVAPKDAATLIVLRDGSAGLEVFCVERSKQSKFMGGAIVFPGGKLDASDLDERWIASVGAISSRTAQFSEDPNVARALAIAASREALEEAALLPVSGGTIAHEDLLLLRRRAEKEPTAILEMLEKAGLALDLGALEPLARWLTPVAESRRYDTRFFMVRALEGQIGEHDAHETMSSFWATPQEVLARFDRGEVFLAPPTHRTLEVLSAAKTVDDAFAIGRGACLDVICPELAEHKDEKGETMALVLPGDPAHSVKSARISGKSRYVLRGEKFVPEDAPRPRFT